VKKQKIEDARKLLNTGLSPTSRRPLDRFRIALHILRLKKNFEGALKPLNTGLNSHGQPHRLAIRAALYTLQLKKNE